MDVFPIKIINENAEAFSNHLVQTVNKSLSSGIFPASWKDALVKPLIKKKDLGPLDINYKPVSNLQYLAKILECATLQQIAEHCEGNNLLPKFQSAYRKGFHVKLCYLNWQTVSLMVWKSKRYHQ